MQELITEYSSWVQTNKLLSAAIQFGILGTLGEIVSHLMRKKAISSFGKSWEIILKIFAWAFLGIIIKLGFVGMKGFTHGLLEAGYLPEICADGLGKAFSISVFTNLFFGPQMMFIHRLEENLIAWKWNMLGLTKAWGTLIWFWIPAHTITFLLPLDFQIGLAALWSVALGIILGLTSRR